jgi:hypothetical protein
MNNKYETPCDLAIRLRAHASVVQNTEVVGEMIQLLEPLVESSIPDWLRKDYENELQEIIWKFPKIFFVWEPDMQYRNHGLFSQFAKFSFPHLATYKSHHDMLLGLRNLTKSYAYVC